MFPLCLAFLIKCNIKILIQKILHDRYLYNKSRYQEIYSTNQE